MDTKLDHNTIVLDQDPFEILNIPENITMNDFKIACSKILLEHHPDKGGNDKTYAVVREAIKQVNTYLKDPTKRPTKNPKSFYDLKLGTTEEIKYIPVAEFMGGEFSKEEFGDKFNEKFNQKADFNSGYTLAPVEYSDPRCEKKTSDLLKEYQNQKDDYAPTNIFGDKPFDRNVFNNIFEQMNKKDDKGIIPLDKLNGRSPGGIKEFSSSIDSGFNIIQPKLSYADMFTGTSSTSIIDDESYQKLKAMTINDTVITEEDRIKMKEKLNRERDWKPEQLDKKPFDAPLVIAKPSTEVIADDFSKKILARNGLFSPGQVQQSQQSKYDQVPKASWLP